MRAEQPNRCWLGSRRSGLRHRKSDKVTVRLLKNLSARPAVSSRRKLPCPKSKMSIFDLGIKRVHCHEITSSEFLKAAACVLSLPSDQAMTPWRRGLAPAPLLFPYGFGVI